MWCASLTGCISKGKMPQQEAAGAALSLVSFAGKISEEEIMVC
jgi:hypothetical protein